MNSPDFLDWHTANTEVLIIALNQVRQALKRQISYLENQPIEEQNIPSKQQFHASSLDQP